ncbi:MAG TPA: NTP transferase domain-containing protein, partial [Leptospiraceae bacterium]|nr:NTP transferase domain-containing protein [Leptospiraceae bacterium]
HGRPLIEIQLETLRAAGVSEIGIVTGYRNETFRFPTVKYFHNSRWSETNMLGSLLTASEWLENEDCLVCYSDILYNADTVSKIIHHRGSLVIPYNTEWLSVWKLRFKDPLDDAETFQTDERGFLTEIGRKASSVEEIKG